MCAKRKYKCVPIQLLFFFAQIKLVGWNIWCASLLKMRTNIYSRQKKSTRYKQTFMANHWEKGNRYRQRIQIWNASINKRKKKSQTHPIRWTHTFWISYCLWRMFPRLMCTDTDLRQHDNQIERIEKKKNEKRKTYSTIFCSHLNKYINIAVSMIVLATLHTRQFIAFASHFICVCMVYC